MSIALRQIRSAFVVLLTLLNTPEAVISKVVSNTTHMRLTVSFRLCSFPFDVSTCGAILPDDTGLIDRIALGVPGLTGRPVDLWPPMGVAEQFVIGRSDCAGRAQIRLADPGSINSAGSVGGGGMGFMKIEKGLLYDIRST